MFRTFSLLLAAILAWSAAGFAKDDLLSSQFGLYDLNDYDTTRGGQLDDPVPPVGNVHALWVVCAPDSHALVWSRPIDRPPSCAPPPFIPRVHFPSTYRMPFWRTWMFDSTNYRSLTSYFRDQSGGLHRLTGDVKGRTDDSIFVSDPDTNVAPLQPFTCWGNYGGDSFFLNIMRKVDAVVDLNDYDVDQDDTVDFVFFNIYGLCEQNWFCQGTGGVSGLAANRAGRSQMLRRHRRIAFGNSVHFITIVTRERGFWFEDEQCCRRLLAARGR
jgi:hypothetical protein